MLVVIATISRTWTPAPDDPRVAIQSYVDRVVQTSWLDADDYASVVVIVESDAVPAVALDLTQNRALQLLARASRQRRRKSSTQVRGALSLLRAA